MQQLIRSFGALSSDRTPCGQPLSVAHAHALMLLSRGEQSQQSLAAALRVDKSTIARLCARMVELGHAQQRTHARDERSRIVALTERGRALARSVDASSLRRFEAVCAELPREQRESVLSALSLLCAAIDASRQRESEES